MKLVGKIQRLSNGQINITPTNYIDFDYVADKEYSVEFKPLGNKRTIQQNKYLWALINEICMTEDGNISKADETYCRLLQMAGAKYETIAIKQNAFIALKEIYRHITIRGKQKEWLICDVFYGSSKMTTTEMAQLLDTTINYAYEVGCPNVRYYVEMLEMNK